jgi:hypothetical protein
MSSLHSEAQLAKVFQAAVDFAMMADLLATLATALASTAASPSAAAPSASSSALAAVAGSTPDAASVESSLAALNISESASASATAASSAEHQSAAVALRNSAYFVLKSLPLSKRFAFTFSCLGAAEKQLAESIFAALTHSVGAPADGSTGIAFAASDLEALHACYK